jgi:hypothetical protein
MCKNDIEPIERQWDCLKNATQNIILCQKVLHFIVFVSPHWEEREGRTGKFAMQFHEIMIHTVKSYN